MRREVALAWVEEGGGEGGRGRGRGGDELQPAKPRPAGSGGAAPRHKRCLCGGNYADAHPLLEELSAPRTPAAAPGGRAGAPGLMTRARWAAAAPTAACRCSWSSRLKVKMTTTADTSSRSRPGVGFEPARHPRSRIRSEVTGRDLVWFSSPSLSLSLATVTPPPRDPGASDLGRPGGGGGVT